MFHICELAVRMRFALRFGVLSTQALVVILECSFRLLNNLVDSEFLKIY